MAKVTKKMKAKTLRSQPSKSTRTVKLKKKFDKAEKTKIKSSNNGGSETKSKRMAPVKLSGEMMQIRRRLLSMLADVRKDIDTEVRGAGDRDLAHINDTSDMASDAAEGDLALRIAESETASAGEIERAIEKIDNGTYGYCEVCNKAIGADRMQFLPYVTLCIKCQELAEIRRREEGDELDDLSSEGAEEDN